MKHWCWAFSWGPGRFEELRYPLLLSLETTQSRRVVSEALPAIFPYKIAYKALQENHTTTYTTYRNRSTKLYIAYTHPMQLIRQHQGLNPLRFRCEQKHLNLNCWASRRRIWTKICLNEALAFPYNSTSLSPVISKEQFRKDIRRQNRKK